MIEYDNSVFSPSKNSGKSMLLFDWITHNPVVSLVVCLSQFVIINFFKFLIKINLAPIDNITMQYFQIAAWVVTISVGGITIITSFIKLINYFINLYRSRGSFKKPKNRKK